MREDRDARGGKGMVERHERRSADRHADTDSAFTDFLLGLWYWTNIQLQRDVILTTAPS